MPQDKRLIITKAVLHKLLRVCNGDAAEAAQEGVFVEFILPSVVLSQCPELQQSRIFHVPHRVYPKNGRTTCLIIPKVISVDCFKINKRHGYYDAVVTAEAICKRGDAESAQRALRVANTFSHFVVDSRIVGKLPLCIQEAVRQASVSSSAARGAKAGSAVGDLPVKYLTTLDGLEERESLSFQLSQGALGGVVRSKRQGQLVFRVGHGGMTAGEVCENAKSFIFTIKKDYPNVWKYIHEFKLSSNKTESIRFMEARIQR